jgi:hypothetical protein
MTNLRPVARLVAAAGLLAAASAYVAPAFAGPAEMAVLKAYEGSWKGQGKVIGTDTESVNCRMSLTDGNDEKINYSGRCALAGANLAISGTLAYIDASHRYEGAMTSNVDFSGVAIGQRVGSGIVFNLKERGQKDASNMEIQAGITLTPGVITVTFKATDVSTGKLISATVPFAKI